MKHGPRGPVFACVLAEWTGLEPATPGVTVKYVANWRGRRRTRIRLKSGTWTRVLFVAVRRSPGPASFRFTPWFTPQVRAQWPRYLLTVIDPRGTWPRRERRARRHEDPGPAHASSVTACARCSRGRTWEGQCVSGSLGQSRGDSLQEERDQCCNRCRRQIRLLTLAVDAASEP